MSVPKTLCRSFKLNITDKDGNTSTVEAADNRKREYDISVEKEVSRLELVPVSNWGDTDETDVFSFDFR